MPFLRIVEADEPSETTLPPAAERLVETERWERKRRAILATAGALLGAAILVLLREAERPLLRAACVALAVSIGAQASASLRRHFQQYDEAAAAHYASGRKGWPDRTQHYRYDYHFATWRCLLEPRCETLQDLWFVRYPDLPIYLLSATGRGRLP